MIDERRSSRKRAGSSPPSPVFDFPPSRFMPAASVSCASGDSAPSDMPPDLKRWTISTAGSTSSSAIGSTSSRKRSRPRSAVLAHGHVVHVGGEALVVLARRSHRGRRAGAWRSSPGSSRGTRRRGARRRCRRPAAARELGGRVGARVAVERLAGHRVEADAAHARGGAGEVAVDHLLLHAHRLEDLRAGVGADGRDPHLGEDLQQALADRLDHALLGLLGGHVLRQPALAVQGVERLEHHVRVDRRGAVADQARRCGGSRGPRRSPPPGRSGAGCPRAPGGGGPRPRPAARAWPRARDPCCGRTG